MRRLGLILWFLLALTSVGCETLFGRQGLPPDPLFVNRRPIESKAKARPPQELPFTEPSPPPNPFAVVGGAWPTPSQKSEVRSQKSEDSGQ